MEYTYTYDTVSEAVNDLLKRGYTTDKECLICNHTSLQLSPQEFEIDEIHRFEGMSDPGDEMIVFAVSSEKHHIKGVVVNAFGVYSSATTSKIMERIFQRL